MSPFMLACSFLANYNNDKCKQTEFPTLEEWLNTLKWLKCTVCKTECYPDTKVHIFEEYLWMRYSTD